MVFSRLNADCASTIVALPVAPVLARDPDIIIERNNSDKAWMCPWGCTIVDEIAPQFRRIQETRHIVDAAYYTPKKTHRDHDAYRTWMTKLDKYKWSTGLSHVNTYC
ncbi:separase-like [Bidens hawaiensis]|uniref:separase-like n=1 Tax=Bidens hawaiensis TaxID=980011 RepID=UPI00404B6964